MNVFLRQKEAVGDKSRAHTHHNSWRERGGAYAYPTPLAATLAALPEPLLKAHPPLRGGLVARRFFGGQSFNFDAMQVWVE